MRVKGLAVSTQVFGEHEINAGHLEIMRNAGFDLVEVFAAPGHVAWEDERAVGRLAGWLRSLGMGVCSLHAPWAPGQDIAALDAVQRERSLRSVQRAADALLALGGQYLVVHPGATPVDALSREMQLRLAEDSLVKIAGYCAERGLAVALENPPPYELAGETADMLRLYQRLAARPGLRACFDTGHAHITPEGVAGISQAPAEVAVIHLSDNTGQADDHWLPPEGSIDWPQFFALLAGRRWAGYLVLELTDRPDATDVLARGRRWLQYMLKEQGDEE